MSNSMSLIYKFVLISLFMNVFVCRGQENQEITNQLKNRYTLVHFREEFRIGDWYNVGKFDRITHKMKYGACDIDGKEIIPPIYDTISKLDRRSGNLSGYYQVEETMKNLGIYDASGSVVVPCEYTYISDYNKSNLLILGKGGVPETKGWAALYTSHARYGLYDMVKKEFKLPCKYAYISSVFPKDKSIATAQFYEGGDMIQELTGNLSTKCIGGKWGYLDYDGNIIIDAQYEEASAFSRDGVAQVIKDGIASILVNPRQGTNLQFINGRSLNNEVDRNIPITEKQNKETFAFVIANENYLSSLRGDYAINDGKVFCEYLKKVLGLPEHNVRFYEDATYGNILKAIQNIKDITEVYEGEVQIIFYYSGLGTVDPKQQESYFLPIDFSMSSLNTTGYKVSKLVKEFGEMKSKIALILFDTSFLGTDRYGKRLESDRGVQITATKSKPSNHTIIFTASDTKESAFCSKSMGHGIFTYALLNKLKSSKGECTLKELVDSTVSTVKKESMKQFSIIQTPVLTISSDLLSQWKNLKF